MKKICSFLLVLAIAVSFSFPCFSENLKIGYVDIFKVFNEYGKTKEYDKKLEEKKSNVEKTLEEKKVIIEKLQNQMSLLKEDKKAKEEEKLKKEIQAYRELEREAFTDIKKERDEKMKSIVEDIDKVVDDYAKENGFDLVVNSNAILYGAKTMDITSQILSISNKKYKAK